MDLNIFLAEHEKEAPFEWLLERFRNWREIELKNTDWTQLPDAPVDKVAWAKYRQALRDFPSNINNSSNTELPIKPT